MDNLGIGQGGKVPNVVIILGVVVLAIILFIIIGGIYNGPPKENFQSIPLDSTKLLLIADTSGNIETVPLSQLINYLRSLETDITQSKTDGVTSKAELSSKITILDNDLKTFINTINQQLSTYQGGATSGAVDAVRSELQVFKASAESQLSTLRNDVNTDKTNIASNLTKFNTLSSELTAFKTSTTNTLNSIATTYMKLGSAYKIKLGSNFTTSLLQQN